MGIPNGIYRQTDDDRSKEVALYELEFYKANPSLLFWRCVSLNIEIRRSAVKSGSLNSCGVTRFAQLQVSID